MKAHFLTLALISLLFANCKKDSKEDADNYSGTYTIQENTIQTFGGSLNQTVSFQGSFSKVSATSIKASDGRTTKPAWTIDGQTITVDGDKLTMGTLNGTRYGSDSIVISYLFGAGSNVYSVKQVWKK